MLQQQVQPDDRQKVQITYQKSEQLLQQVNRFQLAFKTMQSEFSFSNDTIYYIVSTKFINQWKQYAFAKQLQRYYPHQMNQDLYEDGQLNKELVQKVDFQFVTQQIYKIFSPFFDKTKSNKRPAIFIGQEKRVPLYLSTFKYVHINIAILKNIDVSQKPIEQFPMKQIRISQESKLESLIELISQKQRLKNAQCRLWINEKQLTHQKLYRMIKSQLKPLQVDSYKIKQAGKHLDDLQAKISQLMLDQDSFFIFQSKTGFQKFTLLKSGQGRCDSCNSISQLTFQCGCKVVKYCSQKCMDKDTYYHKRKCTLAEEMELNKKVNMTVSIDSRNGLVGLSNLGNTCYMNSCLQCLSNTMPLTNYFLNERFQTEINKQNPLGSKGKLAKNYAKFIKGMWCQDVSVYSPYSVKHAVSDINPMFSGSAQHDSQQFFSFLVDGLHQDLNRILKKPYIQSIEQDKKSQAQVATLSWISHMKRNQSIITDLMSGQYRSIVTCPSCGHRSTTFDPFITVTLPIPQNVQTVRTFFFIHQHMNKKNLKSWFKYTNQNQDQWLTRACQAVGVEKYRCRLYLVSLKENIYKVGREPLKQIVFKIQNQKKNLFLIEFTDQELAIPQQNVVQFTVRLSKQTFSSSSQQLFFKIPMLFDKTNLSGQVFYRRYLKMLYMVGYKGQTQKFSYESVQFNKYIQKQLSNHPFKLLLRYQKRSYIRNLRTQIQFEQQMQIQLHTNIWQILIQNKIDVKDCQIDVRVQNKQGFNFQDLKDFQIKGTQPKVSKYSTDVTLQQCFQKFQQPELLEEGNAWYCPKCKQHKLAKKQLSIYRAPKILILHLKRFQQRSYHREKNDTLVKFPHTLNMLPYLINQSPIQNYKSQINEQIFISTSQPLVKQTNNSQPTYKLYAISNHFGGLGGGHYTAYAKNRQQWFVFNDSSVNSAGSKDVVSSGAYLLFYQRVDNQINNNPITLEQKRSRMRSDDNQPQQQSAQQQL